MHSNNARVASSIAIVVSQPFVGHDADRQMALTDGAPRTVITEACEDAVVGVVEGDDARESHERACRRLKQILGVVT